MAILGFRHKGLRLFFAEGKKSKIQAQHADRLRLILGRLNNRLKGDRQDTWSVRVSGNWRVAFLFVDQDVDQVDYEDYH